jgi:hypothetical protein
MKKELNYLASKRWEKVGRQELCSTPCKREIDPRSGFHKSWVHGVKHRAQLCPKLSGKCKIKWIKGLKRWAQSIN